METEMRAIIVHGDGSVTLAEGLRDDQEAFNLDSALREGWNLFGTPIPIGSGTSLLVFLAK